MAILRIASAYVYFICSTSGHCKIGWSTDPERRLDQLRRTQGPFKYELMGMMPLESEEEAREIEADLHRDFADKRVRGEWFDLNGKDIFYLGCLTEVTGENFRLKRGTDWHDMIALHGEEDLP